MGEILEYLSWAACRFSRREARELVSSYSRMHSVLRVIGAHPDGIEPDSIRFDLVETMRDLAAPGLVNWADMEPGIADLRDVLIAVGSQIGDLQVAHWRQEGDSELLEQLVSHRDEIERDLRSLLVSQGAGPSTIRASEVARGLPSDSIAIGFIRTSGVEGAIPVADMDCISMHALWPNGTLLEFELGPADGLEDLARSWISAVQRASEHSPMEQRRGAMLRGKLLDPVLARIGSDTRTLVICPADFLHAIPFEALPFAEAEVGSRYRVVRDVSLRRFVAPNSPAVPEADVELLALGGVVYGGESEAHTPANASSSSASPSAIGQRGGGSPGPPRFSELPNTLEEVQHIDALFRQAFERPSTLLLKTSATKAAFHRNAPGKRYLHVATHGWVHASSLHEPNSEATPNEPLDDEVSTADLVPLCHCGLALAGANGVGDPPERVSGILTAGELSAIDLSACELAVLSACETHIGIRSAGLGIQSMQSGLHSAGVRTRITSLWKVHDDWAFELMKSFYRHLWVEKLPKAEALWRAKCDVREAGCPKADWAAWVLSGDPD